MQCVGYILILEVVVDYFNLYIGKLALNIGNRPREHTVKQFTLRFVEIANTSLHSDIRSAFVETPRMDVALCALRVFRAALYREIGYERSGSSSGIAEFLSLGIAGMRLATDKLHIKASGGEIGFSHYVSLRAVKVEKNVRRE